MPTWNAGTYLKFEDERTRPCRELAARIALESPRRAIDLGCGPGNSTDVLRERWPESEITGLDSSPDMIAAAKRRHPATNWVTGDIAAWTASVPHDLVFANAALQWVPDHGTVFPHLVRQVVPGGVLAIQVPANFHGTAHTLMRDLAQSEAWRGHFPSQVRQWFVHEPEYYYDLVAPLAARLDLWTTEYFQVMEGPADIVEWYRGSGLRPYLDHLPETEQPRFLRDFEVSVSSAFPRRSDGRVLFPFLRLFLIAYV